MNKKSLLAIILALVAVLTLGACAKSEAELAQEKLELKALADKMHFDSVANDRAMRFEEARNQVRLQDMASGKICIDTLVRIQEIHDTIKPSVEQMYGKYINEICVVTLKIKKESYSLDVTEHAKNEMNAGTVEVPVDRDYFDKVKVGQDISDGGVRMGSLMMRGELSGWSITVAGKNCSRR
jgi:hypothetical protein